MLAFRCVLVFLQTAVKAFVYFNFPRQIRAVAAFVQHRPKLLQHAPCALIGHAKLALQLLRTDTALGRRHKVDCLEPEFQRSSGILKDGPAHRVLVVPAILAGVGRALGFTIMFSNRLTLRAKNTFWMEPFHKPFETSRIIRKVALKLHDSIRAVRCPGPKGWVAVNLAHIDGCTRRQYFRQGDNYPGYGNN